MKVLLLKDVPKVGKKYDAVDVADGYATNFLLARRLAERATPERVAALEQSKLKHQAVTDAKRTDLKEKLHALKGTVLTLTTKADDQGHLFKKIRADDIAHALKIEKDIEIASESIVLESPLHEVGEHAVTVEDADVSVTFSVAIVRE